MKIALFKPPDFKKAPLDLERLFSITGRSFQYAPMGRYCLYHILKATGTPKKVLIPAYICDTVLEPLRKLKIEPVFYDLDPLDLNPSLESIASLSEKTGCTTVLVPSLYGNPADLERIEKFCKDRNITMIDDAAQSFSATLNGRMVGSFGDAGFFSFSPGKPTAGHMGGFFWTKIPDYTINRKSHYLYHFITWLNFYFNRLKTYSTGSFPVFKILIMLRKLIRKISPLENDTICGFEKPVLGGILSSLLDGAFDFRKTYFKLFAGIFQKAPCFRIIQALRGEPHPTKIVLLMESVPAAQKMLRFLNENKIAAINGYTLLSSDETALPNCLSIDGRVVELPIEDDENRMRFLFDKVGEFIKLKL